MIREYIAAAMQRAKYEILDEDHSYYGEIPECQGVWANARTLEECRSELESVLEDWLLVGISLHHTLPVIDGIDINKVYTEPIAA
ncbi:MAG TPA: type II toxin-antitoxin system HicB family antitoxin [Candidatus Kapabacteria bacterium]|nr:type II toxin-antitoxin system HicB family antitoxin [Candidatus Kapabacteria bacterium]